MWIQNKQIAIVGAGPGGLTLARLLQLKGANVRVYERDFNAAARVQGSPLDMHEGSGFAALRKAGLTEAFRKNVRQGADLKIIVNERAEIIFSDHGTQPAENQVAEPARPEIDRGALRKIFLEALQPETVIWDSHFLSMDKQNAGWLLHFKNGSSAYADLVIAADGVHSKIRPYLTNIKASYSGITMVEINIEDAANATPHLYEMLNGGKIMAFGDSKCILGGQKGDGGLGFYLSFTPDENWATSCGLDFSNRAQLLSWFKKEYTGWSRVWYELLEHAVPPLVPRPIYYMPLNQSWITLPNLTVLGDAAHVMPPFAGEGANTAMFDAVELSECLTANTHPTLLEALSFYEVQMRERAAVAAEQSLENGHRMHSEGAMEKMLAVFGIR